MNVGIYARVSTPLHAWLLGQPANFNNIPATFEQIEVILGFGLPATARQKPVPGELIRWQPNNRIRKTRCDGETPDDFLGNSAEGDLIVASVIL